ncbi:hypothetical protein SMC26_19155 [Actinomadura fulvescens]|uniref:Uncharacterized protein n=1 Tax=Actinomadura fulvescens TaxID=46160 RepID=A0ABN3QGK8_9ACTN
MAKSYKLYVRGRLHHKITGRVGKLGPEKRIRLLLYIPRPQIRPAAITAAAVLAPATFTVPVHAAAAAAAATDLKVNVTSLTVQKEPLTSVYTGCVARSYIPVPPGHLT